MQKSESWTLIKTKKVTTKNNGGAIGSPRANYNNIRKGKRTAEIRRESNPFSQKGNTAIKNSDDENL